MSASVEWSGPAVNTVLTNGKMNPFDIYPLDQSSHNGGTGGNGNGTPNGRLLSIHAPANATPTSTQRGSLLSRLTDNLLGDVKPLASAAGATSIRSPSPLSTTGPITVGAMRAVTASNNATSVAPSASPSIAAINSTSYPSYPVYRGPTAAVAATTGYPIATMNGQSSAPTVPHTYRTVVSPPPSAAVGTTPLRPQPSSTRSYGLEAVAPLPLSSFSSLSSPTPTPANQATTTAASSVVRSSPSGVIAQVGTSSSAFSPSSVLPPVESAALTPSISAANGGASVVSPAPTISLVVASDSVLADVQSSPSTPSVVSSLPPSIIPSALPPVISGSVGHQRTASSSTLLSPLPPMTAQSLSSFYSFSSLTTTSIPSSSSVPGIDVSSMTPMAQPSASIIAAAHAIGEDAGISERWNSNGTIASRREAITREQHLTQITIERELAHWNKMGERQSQMNKRMIAATKTCDDLHVYLSECKKLISYTSSSLMQLPTWGKDENGSIRVAATAQELSRKATTQYITVEERIFNDTVSQAALLAKTARNKSASFLAAGAKVYRDLITERTAAKERFQAYDIAVSERQRALLHDEPVRVDPYISCRQYARQLKSMQSAERQYTREMSRLFMEMRIEDGRRIDGVKAVLLDNLLAQKRVLEQVVNFTDNAISAVKGIDREKDVNEYVASCDLLYHGDMTTDGKTAPETMFDTPPPVRDPNSVVRLFHEEVELEGELARQGRVFRGWNPVHAVVTRSGFFHYFDLTELSEPTLSVYLADCLVKTADVSNACVLEIVQPSQSYFSMAPNIYQLKCTDGAQLSLWLPALQKYTAAGLAKQRMTQPATPVASSSSSATAFSSPLRITPHDAPHSVITPIPDILPVAATQSSLDDPNGNGQHSRGASVSLPHLSTE